MLALSPAAHWRGLAPNPAPRSPPAARARANSSTAAAALLQLSQSPAKPTSHKRNAGFRWNDCPLN